MKRYTYQTFKYGQRGAVGVIRCNGVQVRETPMLQSCEPSKDRAYAASACREIIAEMKNAYIVNETAGNKVVKTEMSYAAAYRLAQTWTKNSPTKQTYLAFENNPIGSAPYNSVDGWQ